MSFDQPGRDIAGGAAIQVGQYQHAFAVVEFRAGAAGLFIDLVGVAVAVHGQGLDLERTTSEYRRRDIQHVLAEVAVGYQ